MIQQTRRDVVNRAALAEGDAINQIALKHQR
jgi:hypothetical protein